MPLDNTPVRSFATALPRRRGQSCGRPPAPPATGGSLGITPHCSGAVDTMQGRLTPRLVLAMLRRSRFTAPILTRLRSAGTATARVPAWRSAALGMVLAALPWAAGANLLVNAGFETQFDVPLGSSGLVGNDGSVQQPTSSSFDVQAPANWSASRWSVLQVAGGTCSELAPAYSPALLCPGYDPSDPTKNRWYASVSNGPGYDNPAVSALFQQVLLQPGSYRFGGMTSLRIWSDAIESGAIVNQTKAQMDVLLGLSVLATIDLSPSTLTAADFSLFSTGSDTGFFRSSPFMAHEGVFTLGGADPQNVTFRLSVDIPQGDNRQQSLRVRADNVFIEPTRLDPQPVPAPGALALAGLGLGLLMVTRRRACRT